MSTRTKIKIIKKGTVKVVETPVVPNETRKPDNPSKLASTVSEWISEFHHRRQQETESAIERLPEIKAAGTKD